MPGSPSKVGEERTGRARVAALDTRVTYKGLKGGVSFVPKKNLADHDSSYEFTVGGGSCLPTPTQFLFKISAEKNPHGNSFTLWVILATQWCGSGQFVDWPNTLLLAGKESNVGEHPPQPTS